MIDERFRMRRLSFSLRLAATCLILLLAGGYLAGVRHLYDHYSKKDEQPGLSMDDIVGSFHGVDREASLLSSLDTHQAEFLNEQESAALRQWLEGNAINEVFDNLDLGELAPAEIFDRACLNCHSRNAEEGDGIGDRMPLEFWDDVKTHAYSKRLDPVPVMILTMSTHTHAPSMAFIGLVASLLILATGWPRWLRHFLVLGIFVSLLVDIASWWMARSSAPFSYLIIAAGGLYGAFVMLSLLGALLDLWLGRAKS